MDADLPFIHAVRHGESCLWDVWVGGEIVAVRCDRTMALLIQSALLEEIETLLEFENLRAQ